MTFMDTDIASGWLSGDQLEDARQRVPIVYVEAVPVRVDDHGRISEVGLLLRARPDGSIAHSLVSGRVMYGELLRSALIRNIEKDLGPVALPRLPISPVPFTIAEYFPDESVTGLVDPRQHAISMVYIVSVTGECQPTQSALELRWFTPAQARSEMVAQDMSGGQHRLVLQALAHASAL